MLQCEINEFGYFQVQKSFIGLYSIQILPTCIHCPVSSLWLCRDCQTAILRWIYNLGITSTWMVKILSTQATSVPVWSYLHCFSAACWPTAMTSPKKQTRYYIGYKTMLEIDMCLELSNESLVIGSVGAAKAYSHGWSGFKTVGDFGCIS